MGNFSALPRISCTAFVFIRLRIWAQWSGTICIPLNQGGFRPAGMTGCTEIAGEPTSRECRSGLLLDVFVPKSIAVKPPPLVVWIHGGSWANGSTENAPWMQLVPKGFAAASIRFRLSQVAPMPAQIDDCRAAIRFLRKNASKYGYDETRIGVCGSSAGGHLVALLGTIGEGEDKVQGVVDWFTIARGSGGTAHRPVLSAELGIGRKGQPDFLRHQGRSAVPYSAPRRRSAGHDRTKRTPARCFKEGRRVGGDDHPSRSRPRWADLPNGGEPCKSCCVF